MKYRAFTLALALALPSFLLVAQEIGTASGKGTMDRKRPGKTSGATDEVYEAVSFSPRFSCAYRDGKGDDAATWIVLTEKQPPLKSWLATEDRLEALHSWCGKEKASFIAISLDQKMEVDFYCECPGNGSVTSGMSVANGLPSVVLKLQTRDARRLKGTLRTGQGSCPRPNDPQAYCKPTGDFALDAPVAP